MSKPLGRRERKKLQTRDEILRAAMKLFAERGYHGTTVAEIAEAADIALSTLFAYFPSKEDIVFYDFPRLQSTLREALEGSPDVLHGFREWVSRELLTPPENQQTRLVYQLIHSDEKLIAQERQRVSYFQEQFAMAIGRQLGEPPDALRPQLLAGVAVGATLAAMEHTRQHGDIPLALSTLEKVVRAALESVQ